MACAMAEAKEFFEESQKGGEEVDVTVAASGPRAMWIKGR